MHHAELPFGAFLAAIVVLIPFSWHWRARNVPTLSIIIWLFLDNFILGVNTIVWADNVRAIVPVWCDIAVRLEYASTLALPAACLCLTMRLERISSTRTVSTSVQSRRRWLWFDIAMCWGLPLLYLALYYIVQGHRFDIVEDLGCRFTFYVSVAGLFLVMMPPLVLSFLTLVFAGLALSHFFRRRLDFSRHLATSGSTLTTARYFRLMLMSIVLMFWVLAVTGIDVWFSSRNGFRPWISWENVHSNWWQIGQFPWAFVSQSDQRWTIALWWTVPISAYIFAAFFIAGEDALREYRSWWTGFRRHVLRRKDGVQSLPGSIPGRYVHAMDNMPSARNPKRDTFVSFSKDDKFDNFATELPKLTMDRPILSSSALRSFAASSVYSSTLHDPNSPVIHDPHSPIPSTPAESTRTEYDSDHDTEEDSRSHKHFSLHIHPHDMA
ncbi:STE3-domain-containing protein [Peniophora sp. CONT]|nr:STE3-domain-containing protein [Peniophora sp. CONT]